MMSEKFDLSVLDCMNLAFLHVDKDLCPTFLSSKAALILGIKNRHQLEVHQELLSPLVKLVSPPADSIRHVKPRELFEGKSENSSEIREIMLQTVDRRQFPALCYAEELKLPPLEDSHGKFVFFHDITSLISLIKTIEEIRRSRLYIVKTKCSQLANNQAPTDLLSSLNQAIDIIDPLAGSAVKIVLDVPTSTLLQVPRDIFVTIVSLVLLEVADFVCPYGRTKIKSEIFLEADNNSSSSNLKNSVRKYFLKLTVTATRRVEISLQTTKLEKYLFRYLLPKEHRIHLENEERPIPENLSVALNLAISQGIALQIPPINGNIMEMTMSFPLLDNKEQAIGGSSYKT